MTVVTYFWPGRQYHAKHVRQLAASVSLWLSVPHRFVCMTDQRISGVETLREPVSILVGRCYRRLWLFSAQAQDVLGEDVLHLDLDLVICGDLAPLVTRPVDFAIYKAASIAARGYSLNPSVFYLKTGTQTDIWEQYRKRPTKLAAAANKDGFWGSDQAVISYLRKDATVETFGDADGIVSFRRIRSEQLTAPPEGTRIVSFHGKRTPFEVEIQAAHPWICDAFKVAA